MSVMETCGSVKMEDVLKDTEFVMEQSIVRMEVMRAYRSMMDVIVFQMTRMLVQVGEVIGTSAAQQCLTSA